LKLRYC